MSKWRKPSKVYISTCLFLINKTLIKCQYDVHDIRVQMFCSLLKCWVTCVSYDVNKNIVINNIYIYVRMFVYTWIWRSI